MRTENNINQSELDSPKITQSVLKTFESENPYRGIFLPKNKKTFRIFFTWGESMAVNLRANVSEYTNRVLGVIKEKYGLRDKSEALDKFAEMFGGEFVELEVREDVMREMIRACKEHDRKYKNRRMTLEELDKLFGK